MTAHAHRAMSWTRGPSTPHDRARYGFYAYAFACEVFSCVAVAVFLPIFLERGWCSSR